jgi:hypothetical protein
MVMLMNEASLTLGINKVTGNWRVELNIYPEDHCLQDHQKVVFDGMQEEAEQSSFLKNVLIIEQRLENLETELPPRYAGAYATLFSDARQTPGANFDARRHIKFDYLDDKDENALNMVLAVYHGIFIYLTQGERFYQRQAYMLTFFAAWQWYNVAKRVWVINKSQAVEREMAMAYRSFNNLIDDPRFYHAMRVMTGLQSTAEARQKLRLSMVLWEEDKGKHSLDLPLRAPGVEDNEISWKDVGLYPLFLEVERKPEDQKKKERKNEERKKVVRRLVSAWLLERYDFDTSLHLARLLKLPPGRHLARKIPGGLAVTAAIFALGLAWFMVSLLPLPPWLLIGVFWLFAAGGLAAAVKWGVDAELLPVLLLPRLAAGMVVGYFLLVLQPNNLEEIIWQTGLGMTSVYQIPAWGMFAGLSSSILLLVYVYLFMDIRPYAPTCKEAARRAVWMLLICVAEVLLIGMLVLPLANESCQLIHFNDHIFLLGPLGLVSFYKLLAFAPLALLAGMISQFIWEQFPVTAPVWMMDEE